MAAADRVAPEPGKCTAPADPGFGQRSVAGKEAENIGFPDSIAVNVTTNAPARGDAGPCRDGTHGSLGACQQSRRDRRLFGNVVDRFPGHRPDRGIQRQEQSSSWVARHLT